MKICPRCNASYEENKLENCLVCGTPLAEYTPILGEEEREVLELNTQEVTANMLEEINPENLPEIICSVMGKGEGIRLSKLMQEYNIPCMCKENEEEEDVFDLFIPKKKFNQALEILHEDEMNMTEEIAMELEGDEPLEELFLEENSKEEEEVTPAQKKRWWEFFGK